MIILKESERSMILLKKLGRRLCSTGKNYASYNLYLCSYCNKKVEKQSGYEKRYKSCGCMHDYLSSLTNLKHGDARTTGRSKLYNSWDNMVRRCTLPNRREYKNYGGRGIKVCDKWLKYKNFKEWAVANGFKEGLVIDRIDNNGNYCPENCRWTTRKESNRNQRNRKLNKDLAKEIRFKYSNGETNQSALAREYGVSPDSIWAVVHNKSWI